MKNNWIIVALCAIAPATAAQMPPLESFSDDFIGFQIGPEWRQVVGGTGHISMNTESSPITGGQARLWTLGGASGVARMRLGMGAHTGETNILNWNAHRRFIFEARVMMNTSAGVQATVGLIGVDDPNNVLAAIFASWTSAAWNFQVRSNVAGVQEGFGVSTGWAHTAGRWVYVRIESTGGQDPVVTLWIDDVGDALGDAATLRATYQGPAVPAADLAVEFQLWNTDQDPAVPDWGQVTMWVDRVQLAMCRTAAGCG